MGRFPRSRSNLETRPSRCLRARKRSDPCDRCKKVCPVGAITLEATPGIDASCDGCLACVVACPTGALDVSSTIHSRVDRIWRQLRDEGREQMVFACSATRSRADLDVPCLGGLDAGLLLTPLLGGAAEIVLVRGECAECGSACAMVRVEEVLREVRHHAGALGVATGLRLDPKGPIRLRARSDAARRAAGRASLFASFRRRIQTVVEDQEEVVSGTGAPPTRTWFRERLLGDPDAAASEAYNGPTFSTARVQISEACTGCTHCKGYCPTGAMQRRVEDDVVVLAHDESECVACGQCARSCPEEALTLTPGHVVALGDGREQVVRSVRLNVCGVCGARFHATEASGPFCASCKRRYSALELQTMRKRRAALSGRE